MVYEFDVLGYQMEQWAQETKIDARLVCWHSKMNIRKRTVYVVNLGYSDFDSDWSSNI